MNLHVGTHYFSSLLFFFFNLTTLIILDIPSTFYYINVKLNKIKIY